MQVLAVQATVACGRAGQSVATLAGSQQPALPFDERPQTPAVEQVRAWHALPVRQSAGRQQPVVGTQRPLPTVAPAQNLFPLPQSHVFAVQVAVPPQSPGILQQPGFPFDVRPQTPVSEQVAAWQALPVAHSLAAQQPLVGTQRPFATIAFEQNFFPPLQPQMLLVHAAVPPQSAETLQHGKLSGCFAR
jgi:hypothetical protein